MSGKMPANPSVGSLERALRDLRRDIDSLRADVFTNPKPMRGALDMGGNRIVNVGKPIDQFDVETKQGRAASGVSTFAKSGSAGLTGAVTISEGSNITLTQSGQDIAIAATGTGDALKADPLSQFAATTSAQLAGVISDETGAASGSPLAVFNVNPTLVGATYTGPIAMGLQGISGTGHVVPGANNTYYLGSLTYGWNRLYLSGRTITVGAGDVTVPNAVTTLVGTDTTDSLTNKKLGSLTSNGFVKTSGGDGTLSVDTGVYITTTSTNFVTNKKFDDASVYFYDDGDNTKLMRFQCSGITTATTRTLTVPNADGTIALTSDIPAGLSDGDKGDITVSSSGAVWTIDNNAVSLGKIATQADATILGNNTGGAASPVALSAADTKTLLSLGNVENTALSTWAGSANIATVGTITSGTWTGTDIAVADGGTGRSTGTTAYALIATGTTATGAQQTLASGATTEILVGGGASALPVWTTATGTGAPVRATSPTLVTPALGTPSSGVLSSCTGHKVWLGGYSNAVTVDTTRKFMPIVGTLTGGTTFNTLTRTHMPACTLKEMRFWCNVGPGANTYTVRFNIGAGASTSSFTVTAAGNTTSTGLSLAIAAGDFVLWDIIASAGSVVENVSCIFMFEY